MSAPQISNKRFQELSTDGCTWEGKLGAGDNLATLLASDFERVIDSSGEGLELVNTVLAPLDNVELPFPQTYVNALKSHSPRTPRLRNL